MTSTKDYKRVKKKPSIFWFTAERKIIALLKSSFVVLCLLGAYNIVRKAAPWVKEHFPEILKWSGYLGIAALVIGGILGIAYIYIKINSMKYNGYKKKKRSKT